MYNKRQELIINFIKDNPKSKREDIEFFLNQVGKQSTKMTITRDLKKLIDDGVIEKLGNAKATFKQLFVEQFKQAVKNF